jgi:hypothetical protein
MRSQSVSHRDKDRLGFVKINTVKKGTEVCNRDRRVGVHPPLYTDSSVVEELNNMTSEAKKATVQKITANLPEIYNKFFNTGKQQEKHIHVLHSKVTNHSKIDEAYNDQYKRSLKQGFSTFSKRRENQTPSPDKTSIQEAELPIGLLNQERRSPMN